MLTTLKQTADEDHGARVRKPSTPVARCADVVQDEQADREAEATYKAQITLLQAELKAAKVSSHTETAYDRIKTADDTGQPIRSREEVLTREPINPLCMAGPRCSDCS
jgi:hypothetical protein